MDRPDHYGRHLGAKLENLVYFEEYDTLCTNILAFSSSKSERFSARRNLEEIKRELGIECDVKLLAERRLFRFSMEKKYFDNLLDKRNQRRSFLFVRTEKKS